MGDKSNLSSEYKMKFFYILYHSKHIVTDRCQLNGNLCVVYSRSLKYIGKASIVIPLVLSWLKEKYPLVMERKVTMQYAED